MIIKDLLPKILKERIGTECLKDYVELNEKLLQITEGKQVDKILQHLPHLESNDMYECRKKLKSTGADLYERIIKNRGKVFTAKGGSRVIPLNQSNEKILIAYLNKIRDGISLKKYIEQSLMKAWDSDPMGLCFIEVDKDNNPYPTYKNVSTIYAMSNSWRQLEWVIFKISQKEKVQLKDAGLLTEQDFNQSGTFLRVVDDERDMIICHQGDDRFIEFSSSILDNQWGQVPGFIISNIPDKDNKRFLSTMEAIKEPFYKYIERMSDISLQERLHGTLKYWTHPVSCHKCKGSKIVDGESCISCNGSGVETSPKLSQTLIIPESSTEAKYSTPPAGFISPPKESFDLLQERASHYEQLCMDTYWAQSKSVKATGPEVSNGDMGTATEVLQTNSKEEITLNLISDWAQETESYITDFVGKLLFPGYRETGISYGRRYVTKTPDDLLGLYQKNRAAGMAESLLDDIYADYLESKYEKDPVQLAIQYKLFQLEPFFHKTLDQVKAGITDDEIIKRKAFFGEWKKDITDMAIFAKPIVTLRAEFETYLSSITVGEPEPQQNLN